MDEESCSMSEERAFHRERTLIKQPRTAQLDRRKSFSFGRNMEKSPLLGGRAYKRLKSDNQRGDVLSALYGGENHQGLDPAMI